MSNILQFPIKNKHPEWKPFDQKKAWSCTGCKSEIFRIAGESIYCNGCGSMINNAEVKLKWIKS